MVKSSPLSPSVFLSHFAFKILGVVVYDLNDQKGTTVAFFRIFQTNELNWNSIFKGVS